MSNVVQCRCGQKFKAPASLAGKTVRCTACQQPIKIPAPQEKARAISNLSVQCTCGQQYTVPPTMAGKRVKCQKCGAAMTIPGGPPTRQPQPQPQPKPQPQQDDPLGLGGGSDLASDPLGADPLATDPLGGLASGPTYQPQSPVPAATQQPSAGNTNLMLILGIGGGALALVLLLVIGIGVYAFSGSGNTPVASTDGVAPITDGGPSSDGEPNIDGEPTSDGPTNTDAVEPEPTLPDPPTNPGNGEAANPPANNGGENGAGDFSKDLIGVWHMTNNGGREIPAGETSIMTFTADTFKLISPHGPPIAFAYKLDSSQTPAHFNFTARGTKLAGIIELVGNDLKVGVFPPGEGTPSTTRPESFDQLGVSTMVAHRITDPDALAAIKAGNIKGAIPMRPAGPLPKYAPFEKTTRFNVDIAQKPLSDVLAELSRSAGMPIEIRGEVADENDPIAKKLTSVSANNVTIWEAIDQLGKPIGAKLNGVHSGKIFVHNIPPFGYKSGGEPITFGAFHLEPRFGKDIFVARLMAEPTGPGFTVTEYEIEFQFGNEKRRFQSAQDDDDDGDHDFSLDVTDFNENKKEYLIAPKADKVRIYAKMEVVTESTPATTPKLKDLTAAPKPLGGGTVLVKEVIQRNDGWNIEFDLIGSSAKGFEDPDNGYKSVLTTPDGRELSKRGSGWSGGDVEGEYRLSVSVYEDDLGDTKFEDCSVTLQGAGQPEMKFGPIKDYMPAHFKAGLCEMSFERAELRYSDAEVSFQCNGPCIDLRSFRLNANGASIEPERAYTSSRNPIRYTVEFSKEGLDKDLSQYSLSFDAPTATAEHAFDVELTDVKLSE